MVKKGVFGDLSIGKQWERVFWGLVLEEPPRPQADTPPYARRGMAYANGSSPPHSPSLLTSYFSLFTVDR